MNVNEDLMLGKGEDEIYLKMRSLDLGYNGGYEGYTEEIKRRIGVLI